jgi:hypothetical protein
MVGFGTYLPLSLGISLSSGGLGVCLSLLLDDMAVKFLLSLLQKAKKILLGSDTRNDIDPQPSGQGLLQDHSNSFP